MLFRNEQYEITIENYFSDIYSHAGEMFWDLLIFLYFVMFTTYITVLIYRLFCKKWLERSCEYKIICIKNKVNFYLFSVR